MCGRGADGARFYRGRFVFGISLIRRIVVSAGSSSTAATAVAVAAATAAAAAIVTAAASAALATIGVSGGDARRWSRCRVGHRGRRGTLVEVIAAGASEYARVPAGTTAIHRQPWSLGRLRHLGVLVRGPAGRLEHLRWRTVRYLVQLHAEPVRIDVTLAVFARLLDEDLPIGQHRADEALVRADVPSLGVRVHDVSMCPLAKTPVFAFC